MEAESSFFPNTTIACRGRGQILRTRTFLLLFTCIGTVLLVICMIRIELSYAELAKPLSSRTSHQPADIKCVSNALALTHPEDTVTQTTREDDVELMIGVPQSSSIPRDRDKPFQVYLCGYNTLIGGLPHSHAKGLFPDALSVSDLDLRALRNHTDQDVVISTVAGPCVIPRTRRRRELPNIFKGTIIYLNGEPYPTYPLDRDGVFSVGHEADSPSTIRAYFGAMYLTAMTNESWNQIFDPAQRPKGTAEHFLIYANSNCIEFRDEAFERLARIGTVNRGGACGGSEYTKASEMMHRSWDDNVRHFRPYRFALVMENSKIDGYITEKIINAFLAGTVPIWYGTREVFRVFNHKAFVYYDPVYAQTALDKVAYLESNRTAYEDMLQQSILADGVRTQEKYFSFRDDIASGLLKRRIRRLVGFES